MNRMQNIAVRQQGAALIVALIVMALVSVLGLSALRSSMFSGKVATAVQADAMTYEAAEAAINLSYSQLFEMSDYEVSRQLDDGEIYYGCVSAGKRSFGNSCGSADTDEKLQDCLCQRQGTVWLDNRELLKSRSRTAQCGMVLVGGGDSEGAARAESAAIVEGFRPPADIQYCVVGEGNFVSLDLENIHYLETARRGLAP